MPPLNLVGDFGGGGMLLGFGVVCGLLEAARSGQGQVVDTAMVDGAALLAAMMFGFKASGSWVERGTNLLDTGAFFYEVYETADGRYVSIGSIEPQFYADMVRITGLAEGSEGTVSLPDQQDRASWPAMKERLAAVIRTRTRDEWCALLEGTDACFAPVLEPEEAAVHPHNVERGTFTSVEGVVQPAPAPRFSRTPAEIQGPPARAGRDTDSALAGWGFTESEIAKLRESGAIA